MLRFIVWFLQKIINISYKVFGFFWKLLIRVDSIIEGFWLSVLSEDRLNLFITDFYKKNKQYTQDGQTTKGLYNWEKKIADNIPIKNAKIVVVGAGGGRECLALSEAGYKCTGYESDEKMVNYANDFFAKNDLKVPFHHIPLNSIPQLKCDIFWFGWGMYTHIIGRDKRVMMLSEAKKQIPQNGYIIISYWTEPRDLIRINTIHKTARIINKRSVEKGECFRNSVWSKRFTPEQIREEATMANLKVTYVSEVDYGHAILTPDV